MAQNRNAIPRKAVSSIKRASQGFAGDGQCRTDSDNLSTATLLELSFNRCCGYNGRSLIKEVDRVITNSRESLWTPLQGQTRMQQKPIPAK